MMKTVKACATLVMSALLLSACGGDGGPSDAQGRSGTETGDLSSEMDRRCGELGATTVVFAASETCPDCSAADEYNAIDRADATFASLTAPVASTGTLSLRAASGGAHPAGSNAAVTLSVSEGSGLYIGDSSVDSTNHQDWHVTLRTYLGETLQEQDAGFITVDSDGENNRHVVGITTTQPFDSIEAIFDRPPQQDPGNINVSDTPDTVEPGDVRVHEFCGDFDLSGLDVHED